MSDFQIKIDHETIIREVSIALAIQGEFHRACTPAIVPLF